MWRDSGGKVRWNIKRRLRGNEAPLFHRPPLHKIGAPNNKVPFPNEVILLTSTFNCVFNSANDLTLATMSSWREVRMEG